MNSNIKKQILKEFIFFLKKEKIYDTYLYELFNEKGSKSNSVYFIIKDIKYKCGHNLISRAFTWICTEEGYIFWSIIHEKWIEKISKKNEISR